MIVDKRCPRKDFIFFHVCGYYPKLLALLVWSPCNVEESFLVLTGLSALGALCERELLVCDRVALTLWVLLRP